MLKEKRQMKNNKGFSLVELIVVIAIMAILAAVAIPTFAGFITKANKGNDESLLNDIEYAVELDRAMDGGLAAGEVVEVTVDANGAISAIKIMNGSEEVKSYSDLTLEGVIDTSYEFKVHKDGTFVSTGDGHWAEK
jgi:type IV pilus assembly protein PilA